SGDDPVTNEVVASLSRPGGNLTGISMMLAELMPKVFELLFELVPGTGVIALCVNPKNPLTERIIIVVREAARAKGVQLTILEASTEGEIDAAFASLARLQARALVIGADAFFISRREQFVALAARYAVPAIQRTREFAAAGGLISYGPSLTSVSPARDLRRKDPHGREPRRSAGRAASQVRAGDQPEDRQGAPPHRAAINPRARRRGDRMRRHALLPLGLLAVLIMTLVAAFAYADDRVYRLGFLSPSAGSFERIRTTTFPELARLGFVEGRNLV